MNDQYEGEKEPVTEEEVKRALGNVVVPKSNWYKNISNAIKFLRGAESVENIEEYLLGSRNDSMMESIKTLVF